MLNIKRFFEAWLKGGFPDAGQRKGVGEGLENQKLRENFRSFLENLMNRIY